MKKSTKIVLCVIATIVLLGIIFWIIDYNRVKNNKMPIFTIKTASYWDGGSSEYVGFGYKVVKCNTLSGDKSIHIGFYNLNVNGTCNNDSITFDSNEFIIVDETELCADALEELYRDEKYIYYLPCIQSETIFIKYNDGTKVTIRKAIEEKLVTIEELIEKGLEVYKNEINPVSNDNNSENKTDTSSSNNNNNGTSNSNSNNSFSSSNNNSNNNNNSNSNSNTQLTCTPKKFIWSWFRPDFTTQQACINKGNSYMAQGYGYYCDDVPDDCGTRYYMLILFDDNGEYDWHDVSN